VAVTEQRHRMAQMAGSRRQNSDGRGKRFALPCAVSALRLACLGVCAAWMAAGSLAGAQDAPSARTQAHLLAAQEDQRAQRYELAEQEYRAVLAEQPRFAEVHMNLGLIYQLQNRIAEAVAEFQQALQENPHLAGANFFLGVDLCKVGEARKALPYLKTAVDQQPDRPELLLSLATAYEMTGQFENEVATAHRALELEPGNVDLLYRLGHTYEALGSRETAELETYASSSSRTEQLLGESYAESSDLPTAVLHFRNALTSSPKGLGLHVELGEVQLRAGNVTRALGNFEEELSLDPHSVRAHLRRGEAKLLLGDMDALFEDWALALGTDETQAKRILGLGDVADSFSDRLPDTLLGKMREQAPKLRARDSPLAHLALAFIAVQSGDVAQPEAELSSGASRAGKAQAGATCSPADVGQALERHRISSSKACMLRLLSQRLPAELRLRIAFALFDLGDYNESLAALSPKTSSVLAGPELLYLRARCYERLATGAYLTLYQKDRNSYRVHQLLGELADARKDDVTAIAEYRTAIDLKPAAPELHYSLGHLLWENFKVGEARSELEAELAINPHHAGAMNDLGQTYLLEQQPDKALDYLKRAAGEGLDSPELHRDLGTAYAKLGKYEQAGLELNRALPSDHDGSIHFKLANVYKATGEKDKAAREFALAGALNGASHQQAQRQEQRRIDSEK